MSRNSLKGLVVINAVLLLVLGVLSFAPSPAEAQLGGRRAGDYLMVAGTTPGKTGNTVYITDLNNSAMIAVNYNSSRRALITLGTRDLTADFTAVQRGR